MHIENAIYNIAGKTAVSTLYTTHTPYATREHATLTLDGCTYDGLDRWINRPWYEYKYQNARVDAAYMCAKTEPERYEAGRAALQVLEDLESVRFADAYTIVYTSHAGAVLTWHASRMSRESFTIESEA